MDPSSVDSWLVLLPFSFNCWLALLQTATAVPGTAANSSIARNLTCGTPMPPSALEALKLAIIKTCLEALDPAELAKLATTSSSNTVLFSLPLQQLVLHSAAAAPAILLIFLLT
jgi:hypothetical protein